MNCSTPVSSAGAMLKIPALLTRMSGAPPSSAAMRFGCLLDFLRIGDVSRDGNRVADARRLLLESLFGSGDQNDPHALLAQRSRRYPLRFLSKRP